MSSSPTSSSNNRNNNEKKKNVNNKKNNNNKKRSKRNKPHDISHNILTPELVVQTADEESKLLNEIKEEDGLLSITRPNSRIEDFLLRSAASSASISSQYSDLRNEFSKYSRPRSGKDDDWRGSPTGFSPRSRGRAVSRGLMFGGRPSTRGSLGDLEYNMSGDGEEEYDDEASHASDIENEDLDAIKSRYRKNVHLSLLRVSCTTIQLRCENPDQDHLQLSEDGIVWRSIYWVNEPRFLSRTITCLIPGQRYFFRLEQNDSVPEIECQTLLFPSRPPIPTAWKVGRGMPVPIVVTTDFISVSWMNPPDVQQWEMAIAIGIDGPHGLEPGTWKRCGNVGGHGQHGIAEPGRMFFEFPGLRANQTYFIRIRFRNNMGWSKSSKPLEVSTAKGETASAPKNFVILQPVYFSYVTLEWLPPRSDGGIPLIEAIVEYVEVEKKDEDGKGEKHKKIILGDSDDEDADEKANVLELEEMKIRKKIQTLSAGLNTKFVVPDLKPNTVYQFRVTYRNERGIGAYSSVLQAKTLKFWVPSPPKAPKLQIINGTSVKIDFDLQYHDHCIEYEVQYSKDKMFRWTSGGKGTTSPMIIDGLEDFEYYFFRVKARNKRGWSRGGEPVIGKTTANKADNKAPKLELGFVKHTPTTVTLECNSSSGGSSSSSSTAADAKIDTDVNSNRSHNIIQSPIRHRRSMSRNNKHRRSSLLLRDQSLSSTMFSSTTSLLNSEDENKNEKCLKYQIEYSTDSKAKTGWKKSEHKGHKGHVKIRGLRPAMLYFAKARSQSKAKQWSKFSNVFSFITRDYNENENVLVRGEGPWEKDEGFYPAIILKVLKPGEYYSIQREGRGFREDVVHRDFIKEIAIRKNLHAFGRVGRLLARSRSIHVEKEDVEETIEVLESKKTVRPGIRGVWLYGTHQNHETLKKDRFGRGRDGRLLTRSRTMAGKKINKATTQIGKKANLRSMSQKDLFHHKHEETNNYLSLKGLPHGTIVQLSKVDIRNDRTRMDRDHEKDGLEESRKNLRKNERGVFYRMTRPIHLLREIHRKNKAKKNTETRKREMNHSLKTRGKEKHVQTNKKLYRYISPIKDQSVTMVENERIRYENEVNEWKEKETMAMRDEEATKKQFEIDLHKTRHNNASIKYSK